MPKANQAEEGIAKIPVFVLSSSVSEKCRAEAHKLGAAGCYVKPDRIESLKKIVISMLNKVEKMTAKKKNSA